MRPQRRGMLQTAHNGSDSSPGEGRCPSHLDSNPKPGQKLPCSQQKRRICRCLFREGNLLVFSRYIIEAIMALSDEVVQAAELGT